MSRTENAIAGRGRRNHCGWPRLAWAWSASRRLRPRPVAPGLLPLALGLGEGGETQAPMGRAIIGGVITSTLLTLVVVPVLFTYLDGWAEWRKARRVRRGMTDAADPAAAPAHAD